MYKSIDNFDYILNKSNNNVENRNFHTKNEKVLRIKDILMIQIL